MTDSKRYRHRGQYDAFRLREDMKAGEYPNWFVRLMTSGRVELTEHGAEVTEPHLTVHVSWGEWLVRDISTGRLDSFSDLAFNARYEEVQ